MAEKFRCDVASATGIGPGLEIAFAGWSDQLRRPCGLKRESFAGNTHAGETYVAACRRILDAADEAERGATREYVAPTGELIISAPILFGRLYVLREFEPAAWPVSLVYTGGRFLPLKARAFVDFAAPRLKAQLQHLEV